MPTIQLPDAGRPYVLVEAKGERSLSELDQPLVIELYQLHGALLFRGFDPDVPQFRSFTRSFCPTHVVNESRGRAPIDPQHNIHTVSLGTRPFALHSELSREPWKPDAAFFFCLSAPVHGGATTLCDGVELVRAMPDFVRQGLTGRRLLHVKPTWPELFSFWLGDSNPNDELLANPPPACPYEFRRIDGGIARIFSRPVLHRPMFKDEPAFANYLLFARFMHNQRSYPLLDDGQPVPDSWLHAIRDTGDRLSADIAWQRGDVLMLDNTRFMHGRRAITSVSERLIATSFGYLAFAVPDPEEPPNALWRRANFAPPVRPPESLDARLT